MKTVRWSLRAALALCVAALLCLLGLPAGAAEPVYLDSGNGLIKGHDNGTIDPQGTTERAQAAAVLMRFCQQFVE